MSKNLAQVYAANPVTTIGATDLLYVVTTGTTDAGITGANFIAAMSPLTTKGDLFTYSTVNARLAVAVGDGKILQVSSGAATGLAWSTPTYPSTSGSAGKILRSDGTNNLYTTATYPNVGTSTGSFLYADGTNWVASTSLWPNTVGASGKFVASNGTTNVYTTATFPVVGGAAGNILISDGTNYIASTSLWPNTVGSAGKILRSDGTTNAYTTATYPNVGTSTGSFLYADGTNWVASTSLWPNTVGTSGKVVISNGTNNVYSTPTYPNAAPAAGAILIGDGTNYITSTSLWPNTVGSAGKIIRSDGTTNAYTTATFADTYAVSTILYASSSNVVSGLTTANSARLGTSASGVPSMMVANIVTSSSCGNFTGSSATYADVTNLSVSITTTGRPVMLILNPADSANPSYLLASATGALSLALFRGATQLNDTVVANTVSDAVSPSSFSIIDVPAAGTYTYKVQYKMGAGTGAVQYSVLTAIEL